MLPAVNKIKSLQELMKLREQCRVDGKKVVTTNGSFDIVHVGHLRALEESKQQGDVLIVGINSDLSVKAYKSADRPIIAELNRAELIAGLECVDYVFIFDELDPVDFINVLKPDVHTNSAEYGENCVEAAAVKVNGGRLHLIGKKDSISTTEIINKILSIFCTTRK